LAGTGNVLERIEDGQQVGKSLASAVVGIDDHAQIPEVVLKSDGERLGLHKGRLLNQVGLACIFVALH